MDWFKSVLDEATTLVKATWPQIGADAFWLQVNALSRNIVSQAAASINKSDSTKIGPPIAILCFGKVRQEDNVGIDPYMYRLPCEIAFIAAKVPVGADAGATLQEYCHAQANLLLAAFQNGSFSTFEVMGDDTGNVDSSAEIAFAEESLKLLAAKVSFPTGLLVRVDP